MRRPTPMIIPLLKVLCFLLLTAMFACDAQTAVAFSPASTVLNDINVTLAELGIKAEGEGLSEGEGEVDTVRPTATLSSSAASTVQGAITVNLVLSEYTPAIAASAIATQNATVSGLSGSSGTQFTFTLTPLLHGAFSASIAENQFFDAAGNGNLASNVLSKNFDSRPRGTFSAPPKNPVYSAITVTLEASEFIPNISSSALTLVNATASALSSFSGMSFTFELVPIVPGAFSVSIAANQFSDSEGNGNKSTGVLTRHYVEWVDEEDPEVVYPTGDAIASKLTSNLSTKVGRSVSIDGDRLVAGADERALGWAWQDAAWQSSRVFSNWSTYQFGSSTYELRLTGFSAFAVAVFGDVVILGSPYSPHQRWPQIYSDGTINRYLWDEPSLGFDVSSIGASTSRFLGYDVALAEWNGDIFYFAIEPAEGKIYSNESGISDSLGMASVDAWRSIVVAGAPDAAYAFNATGPDWTNTYRETMTLDGSVEADDFGADVSVHGHTALVSAPGENEGGGAVYVFVQGESGWTQQARLVADDGAAGDVFGKSVAIWGNTAVVGAPDADGAEGAVDTGAVYIFRRASGVWTQIAKLTADDADAGDKFGMAVDIGATDIAVGAPGDDELGTDAGAVYVYTGGYISESVRELMEGASDGEGSEEGTLEGIQEGSIEGVTEGIVEGILEGVFEGVEEGTIDGMPEGRLEGIGEGDDEGSPEGVSEGEVNTDGVLEGVEEGVIEGVAEGTLEGGGESEGEGEGLSEGRSEGRSEGLSEGTREGIQEGEGEGETSAARHSMDTNANSQVDLNELLRVIQLYNGGAFGCALDTEDGFAPDGADIQCTAHSGDYNPQDWKLSLSELLRIVQLYNVQGFAPCAESEDGFCPVQ